MPKIIELTVEIDIQRVSCPGVWLCQDGRVSLTVLALGTSYQTCLLPPIFPLMFKDIFYFRKRFQESCALNNICCLLKDESIYCELVQWCDDCASDECVILAQYLGALNDVLFPPNMCSSDGVDLLMRRSKDFPGILSPKIEIATKVRIDEVWNQPSSVSSALKIRTCHCSHREDPKRQKQVCHSARYHRNKCIKHSKMSSSRSRSGSTGSRSCCSLTPKPVECVCPIPYAPPVGHKSCVPRTPRRAAPRRMHHCREFCVYNVQTQSDAWKANGYTSVCNDTDDDTKRSIDSIEKEYSSFTDDERSPKTILESHYIDYDKKTHTTHKEKPKKKCGKTNISPCVCEICKRYHELFHMKNKGE